MSFETMRRWLEIVYFLSGPFTAIAVVVALLQLRFLKRDYDVRVERAAKERAIDASQRYLTRYVAASNRYFDETHGKKLNAYNGPIGDFSPSSIPSAHKQRTLDRAAHLSCVLVLNELESVAATFTTGVGDEAVGFSIIGRSFISSVQHYYDIIAITRDDSTEPLHWSNTVILYRIWSARLTSNELKHIRDDAATKLADVPLSSIKPLGRD